MKKVSKIITATAFVGLAVVAASCAKPKGKKLGQCTKDGVYNFYAWTGFGKDYSEAVDGVMGHYNDKHCGQIRLYHEAKSNYDTLRKEILDSRTAADTLPNFACGYPDHFADYYNLGILNPLDEYIARYKSETGVDILEDYEAAYMTENQEIAYDDQGNALTVGLPFNKSTEVMLANGYYFDFFKEKLAAKGYTLEVPQTWDKLAEIGPKLREIVDEEQLESPDKNFIVGKVNTETNTAYDFKVVGSDTEVQSGERIIQNISTLNAQKPFYALGYDSTDNAFITILHQSGVPYTKVTTPGKGKAVFWTDENKAQTVAAVEVFENLFKAKAFAVPQNLGEELYCTVPLQDGRVLFTVGSSGGLNKPKTFDDRRLDINPIPYRDAAHKEVISQGTSLGLIQRDIHAKTNEEYDETMYQAFTAMVELTTGELQAEWVSTTGYFPSSKSALNHPTYQKVLNGETDNRLYKLYRQAGTINKDVYSTWTKFVDSGFASSNSIRSAVKTILPKLLDTNNHKSAEDIIQSVWNDMIDSDLK